VFDLEELMEPAKKEIKSPTRLTAAVLSNKSMVSGGLSTLGGVLSQKGSLKTPKKVQIAASGGSKGTNTLTRAPTPA